MRLEEADEPSQAAKPRDIRTAISELDPVVTYGSFGQVLFAYICNVSYSVAHNLAYSLASSDVVFLWCSDFCAVSWCAAYAAGQDVS